jgi:hypothetical protein
MISILFSLLLTLNLSLSGNDVQPSPAKEQKTIDDYFKQIRKAAGAEPLDYKIIEMASSRYMKISHLEDGEPAITELYYWSLGFDLEVEHILIASVTFREGYGTVPSFVIYKDGVVKEPRYSEIISNWDNFTEFNESFEQNKTSDPFCCDLRVFLPRNGESDMFVYSVKDEIAKKLKDRPSNDKLKKIGTLKYDMFSENFEFVKD